MKATRVFGHPYDCKLGNIHYLLDSALDYDNNTYLEVAEVKAKRLFIPCNDGVLVASYTGKLTGQAFTPIS
jgi:hypothetical protein